MNGVHIPSHGHGYLKPVQPGEIRNPTGKDGLWREAQRITREKSPEAARRPGELMNGTDERVALMATDKVLTWAWGKPPEYDPREDSPDVSIDTSILSPEADHAAVSAATWVEGGGDADGDRRGGRVISRLHLRQPLRNLGAGIMRLSHAFAT